MNASHFIAGDSGVGVLTLLIFSPLVGALLLYALPLFGDVRDPKGERARAAALIVSTFTLAIALLALTLSLDMNNPGAMQFGKRIPWIPQLGISYLVGVDGISLMLVLLTALLLPLVIISAQIQFKFRAFFANLLLVESALLGTLLALDLFLFYLFWELMLAPMYFLIGIWGGKRRIYATLKFVVYTVAGSVLMLVGMLYVVWSTYRTTGVVTFALDQLISFSTLSLTEQVWLFALFAIAFGVKVPLFPFHTWMADAYAESPTAALVISSGIMIKLGLYGLIRFAYPLFPNGAVYCTPLLAFLAVFGILYGGLVAWRQGDIRRLLAFSSLSHLGFCVLGVFAFETISITGAIFQSVCHGVTAAALFILLGILIDQRRSREISEFGGLAAGMPRFAFFLLLFTLSSIALPLTNSFVGEFLILIGSFKTLPYATVAASVGVIIGAIYMLSMYQRLMFGPADRAPLRDLNALQIGVLLPLVILVFYLGIFPGATLATIEPAVREYVQTVNKRRARLEEATPVLPRREVEVQNVQARASILSQVREG